jgi:hypothetical protein
MIMQLTVNDFRRISYFSDCAPRLDCHQLLKWKQNRRIQSCQSILHRTPIICQLPSLRQQRIDQQNLKIALLLAIAQEYGTHAVHALNHYPHYWSGHKILNGRKISRLLQTLDQFYQPLGKHSAALPRFITDDLLQGSKQAVATSQARRARCVNTMVSRSQADVRKRRLQKQINLFLLSESEGQTLAQQQLKQALTRGQISDDRFQSFLKLSKDQQLVYHGFMVAYQRLPASRTLRALPLDRTDHTPRRTGNPTAFSTLPIAEQLSILGEAAASRTGYRRKIDLHTQQLLMVKGLPRFNSYYSRRLEKQLAESDRRLSFMGEHLYSTLGLSAHLITRELPQGRELSLVFGGFSSHPTLLGKVNQARAILNNFLHLPWEAMLYQEAAELAKQAAYYARQQGFATFTVSGHSLGGSLAEYAVGQYPELIHQAKVFQAFHVMGSHRLALNRNHSAQSKITSVEVKHDWVTSPLVHRRLGQTRTIVLYPKRYDQAVHGQYDRQLFKAAMDNLTKLSSIRPAPRRLRGGSNYLKP